MAAEISVKADLDDVMKTLSEIDGNKEKMRKRVLSGIASAVKSKVKSSYRRYLNKRSGTLYKSIQSKVCRDGRMAIVSPSATSNGVRYGYVLAKGTTIIPKKANTLTFQIDGKWIRKHSVTIPERDWVEKPARDYIDSPTYKAKLGSLVQKEIDKAEKRKARNEG